MTTSVNHHDEAIAPELADLHLEDKPDGPGAAAMLSAGIGIFVLGLFTVLSEASEPIHDFLDEFQFGRGVGPLAGKTILAIIAYFVSWIVLHMAWRTKDVDIKRYFYMGLALGLLGALFMFPPFFLLFA